MNTLIKIFFSLFIVSSFGCSSTKYSIDFLGSDFLRNIDKVNEVKKEVDSLLNTHNDLFLEDNIHPKKIDAVLMNGKIVKSGGADLALELEKKGYENFN